MARLNELRAQLNIERVRDSGLLIGFDLVGMNVPTLVNQWLAQGVYQFTGRKNNQAFAAIYYL